MIASGVCTKAHAGVNTLFVRAATSEDVADGWRRRARGTALHGPVGHGGRVRGRRSRPHAGRLAFPRSEGRVPESVQRPERDPLRDPWRRDRAPRAQSDRVDPAGDRTRVGALEFRRRVQRGRARVAARIVPRRSGRRWLRRMGVRTDAHGAGVPVVPVPDGTVAVAPMAARPGGGPDRRWRHHDRCHREPGHLWRPRSRRRVVSDREPRRDRSTRGCGRLPCSWCRYSR